tara:strand:- start:1425 stop:3062 length:1638 start_codon:yes stop_codon:yes gene_type:complete
MALDVKVIFDLDNSKLKIEDNNNYSSGYSFSGQLNVVLTVTGPGGAVHAGGTSSEPDMTILASEYTPSIDLQGNRKWNSGEGITLPSSLTGAWTVAYKIYDNAGSGDVYTETYSFNYGFSLPAVSVGLTVTQNSSLITSTDSTNYSSSYTNDSLTRNHRIHPPAGATTATGVAIPEDAESGTASTINYTGITTGSWRATVSSTGEWSDGSASDATTSSRHYVTGTPTGGSTTTVNSDLGLCDVYCCLKALNDRYEQAKCKNKDLAEEYKAKIEDVTRMVTLYVQAVTCGLTGDAECYINDIKTVSECGTECNCYGSGSAPANIPIVSKISTDTFVIENKSERLSLTSSGSGTSADPVIYSMDLGPSISSNIAYIAENIHETNSSINRVESEMAEVLESLELSTESAERLTMKVNHNYSNTGVSIVKKESFRTGSRFYSADTDDISVVSSNTSESTWKNLNNSIVMSNIYDSKWRETDFYVEAIVLNNPDLEIDVFTLDKKGSSGYGSFYYRFINKKGYVLTNNNLKKYGEIQVSFDLISDSKTNE